MNTRSLALTCRFGGYDADLSGLIVLPTLTVHAMHARQQELILGA